MPHSIKVVISAMTLIHRILATLFLGLTVSTFPSNGKPNFLVIIADDCTYNDLPLYGGQNAKTPNIDKLASQGLTFNRAYLAEAMCQPCRAELYSGQYPMRNGSAWNHSACRSDTTGMPQHLSALGYRVGLAGKTHIKPQNVFPFESVPGFDKSCVRDPTHPHELEGIEKFIKRDASQPFCLVVALVEPHIPWVMGDASKYPPAKLKLPPHIADTPSTRKHFSDYLAEITYMDGQVGQILEVLEASGKDNETLVLFSSEQGSQFPGCKWTNWDTGLHTALIARWPDTTPVGKRTDALVQFADVLPTFVDAAGGKYPKSRYDGTSFLKVIQGRTDVHREFAFGMHNNLPEGPPYPTRTVTDGSYRYIINLLPDNLYIEKHLMGGGRLNNPYWHTWVETAWQQPRTYQLIQRYQRRPAEQLYHTAADNFEMTNLAGSPEHSVIRKRLAEELRKWMKSQKDPGEKLDTMDAYKAARAGKHLY